MVQDGAGAYAGPSTRLTKSTWTVWRRGVEKESGGFGSVKAPTAAVVAFPDARGPERRRTASMKAETACVGTDVAFVRYRRDEGPRNSARGCVEARTRAQCRWWGARTSGLLCTTLA